MASHPYTQRIDYAMLCGAFAASWIFHCIMIVILTTTNILYPPAGSIEKVTFNIFWASLSSVDGTASIQKAPNIKSPSYIPAQNMQTVAHTDAHSETTTADDDTAGRPVTTQSISDPLEMLALRVPETDVHKSALVKNITKEKQLNRPLPVPEVIRTSPLIQPGADHAPPVLKSETPGSQHREIAGSAVPPKTKTESDKTSRKEQTAVDPAKRVQAAAKSHLEPVTRSRNAVEQKIHGNHRAGIETGKSARPPGVHEKLSHMVNKDVQVRSSQRAYSLPALPTTKTENSSTIPASAATDHVVMGSTVNDNSQLSSAAAKQQSLALPSIKGDIKLIVTSEDDLLIRVLFIKHPLANHTKPLKKSEAKDIHKLSPKTVRTSINTLETVIETAREGIYIFQAERKGFTAVEGKFILKLFDSVLKQAGGKKIYNQTEIARLLMPEGILWEEDSAFSGSIEDSDGTTKFNAETGMVWKEFRK